MRIALWDTPLADQMAAALEDLGTLTVERQPPERCRQLVDASLVDAALVPSVHALRDPQAYDLLAGAALSTWMYPFAQLYLEGQLGDALHRVAYDPAFEQEKFVVQVALREHYNARPRFVPMEEASMEELLGAADVEASLVVGDAVPQLDVDRFHMDVGQEWYELANYPMVWGLFVSPKDQGQPAMVEALVAGAKRATAQAATPATDIPGTGGDDAAVRFHLDDLAIASLTELSRYLFYYGQSDDVPELTFVTAPEEDDEDGEVRRPLI